MDISIIYEDFDEEHYIVILKKAGKNIFFDFGLSNFENEMEYWDMPTKLAEHNGDKGFIFNKALDKKEVEEEIRRFIKHNDL